MMNLLNELTVGAKVYFAIMTVINLTFFGFLLANLIKIVRKIKNDTFSSDDKRNQKFINSIFAELSLAIILAYGIHPEFGDRLKLIWIVFFIVSFIICYIPLTGAYVLTIAYDHKISEPVHGTLDKSVVIVSSIVATIGLILIVTCVGFHMFIM